MPKLESDIDLALPDFLPSFHSRKMQSLKKYFVLPLAESETMRYMYIVATLKSWMGVADEDCGHLCTSHPKIRPCQAPSAMHWAGPLALVPTRIMYYCRALSRLTSGR